MRRSFYEFLMTLRNVNSSEPEAEFANNAHRDQSFPKQETDYEKISNYLELNAGYLPSMTIFDEAYQKYQDTDRK
ncbi:YozE family protein [Companilactobacillus hulinensis]|uniref:YozE family protein n=1 Tax=Companilactobacillus hulinensis TaxID=2486007 RepID=UPI000F7AE8E3|nr:YozE family protein [Companilactobacillus hulinensis]